MFGQPAGLFVSDMLFSMVSYRVVTTIVFVLQMILCFMFIIRLYENYQHADANSVCAWNVVDGRDHARVCEFRIGRPQTVTHEVHVKGDVGAHTLKRSSRRKRQP
jgi:hypothetical protein